jgi:lysophospholipase L1-like esterase
MDDRDPWRLSMRREANRRDVVLIDLVDELQQLTAREVADLYIPDGSVDYPFADGHFNADGNAWIAEKLYEELQEVLVVR